MSKITGISWTDHTWNPWEGCSKVSPGCAHCYMFPQLERYGRDPSRVRRTKTWTALSQWNEAARRAGRIDKVFTCSLSDFFHEDADAWRPEAWELIRRCTHLHFQVLTKRPLGIRERLPPDWGGGYPSVWLGVSIESNDYVWRADVLRQIPSRVRWISAEPLLGSLPDLDLTGFHWIVVGGESGPGFRDMDHAWARQIRDAAKTQNVAFFFKQSAGARSGSGDLLDGREWKDFPEIPPQPPAANDEEEGQVDDKAVRPAEDRPEAEKVTQQHEQEQQRQEEARLQSEQEAAPVSEMERQEMERLRVELESLRAERERQRVELESLQATLEQNRHDSERDRADWKDRLEAMRDNYLQAAREEKRWRSQAEEALSRAATADYHLRNLLQILRARPRMTSKGFIQCPP